MSHNLGDPRAYLQQRVALFTGVSWVFFAAQLLVDFATPAAGEPLLSSTRLASMMVLVSHGSIWLYTRKGVRSALSCRALELAGMAVAMGAFATLPLFPPIEGAGGIMSLFGPIPMAVVVLLRSAIIPSPAWLSVVVSLTWGIVMVVCGIAGWEGIVLALSAGDFQPWQFPLAHGGFAAVALSFVAGVISHVVYGLQTKVREAMQFGQYTLETKIGEGGMGAVYRARHRMLRRPTAIKLLPPEKSGERSIARFEREVQQTSRLTHPNTVAIFDFGRTQDGVFYYAMEYLDGISLQDLVEMTGPLPPERVVHALTQVADSLAEAHAMGLVHRDIKPDNIVLCERGGAADVVKVLDFGLVKEVDAPEDAALSATNTIQGTPLYIAPESLTDPDSVDGRTDLYALGAVAYFLLTGEPVFRGNVVEVFGHHLHSQPDRPTERGASTDSDLEAIVMRCLEKEPNARFDSAAELGDALRACSCADKWTRTRAQQWWDGERQRIRSRRHSSPGPAGLTVAPA